MTSSETSPEFEALLNYLKYQQGCDLTGYKRSTLMRRFGCRMQQINIDSYQSYFQYLKYHPEEYANLLNEVLINVTTFFRDRDAWDYLATDIIPKIISSKQPNEPIRVWSAGCATGQEVYSILILFAEALGIESCVQRVQCYATDADESALKQARQGYYSAEDVASIPADWLEKYFSKSEQGYTFRLSLRRSIIFGRHDLVKNAPMSKIDLLICRNVLIYFNLEAQISILTRFHFALKSRGFLFLGKAETLINHRPIFTAISQQHHIYTKGSNLGLRDHLALTSQSRQNRSTDLSPTINQFWQAAFETGPLPQLAVGLNGFLIDANQQARNLFELTPDDWNRPFQEREPGKLLGSQAFMANFYRHHHPITLKNVEWSNAETIKYFDIAIAPVYSSRKQLLGIILTFLDQTNYQKLIKDLKGTNIELHKVSEAYQETYIELEAAYQEIDILTQNTSES